MNLARVLAREDPRALGFDDAPFAKRPVPLSRSSAFCSGTRWKGCQAARAAAQLGRHRGDRARMFEGAKFATEHAVLLDGIAVGGFNVVDPPALHAGGRALCGRDAPRPTSPRCTADQAAPAMPRRLAVLAKAGAVHRAGGHVFQGGQRGGAVMAAALTALTREGAVPRRSGAPHRVGGDARRERATGVALAARDHRPRARCTLLSALSSPRPTHGAESSRGIPPGLPRRRRTSLPAT